MTSYHTISTPQDYVNYTFNISSRGIAEVSGEMVGLSNTVTTILGQLAFKTSEYLTHTESAMIGLGTAAVASFASSTQEAIKFEQAIANVQAIGGESINAMDIGQAAMRYSNQFGMDVNSMTEGLEALSRAGLTATNVMSGVLAEGVKLSKLEGMDLEDSINDLISTTNLLAENQYDVNSQEYADAVKAMNQHIVSTSESAPINAQNIIQTLQHAGGYVSSAKIDQDDLFAVIAQLGSKGTKGEMAGTALRAFIAAGQKDQAQRALSRIGLDVSDLWDESGNIMLPVSEMKQVLDDALEARGYSQQEKLEFYSDFAGYKQANQIMKIDTSEVQEYKKTIEQAWDLGTKLETILGTTHNNIQTLFQTVKNFMTRTGSTILPLINAIIIPIKWGVQLLDAMPFSENIVGMALAFAGLKAAVLFINRVIPSIAGLYTSLSKSNDKAEGVYGHFKNFRKELEQSRDILEHISDKDYLANIRVHQGLMGRQSHIQHKDITKTLYTDVFRRDNPDILPWEELSSTQKELYYSIAETLKNTNAYQNIIDQFNKANEGHVRRFIDAFKNNNENRPKSNLETNKEKHLSQENEYTNLQADNIRKDFVTITGQVREIQNHIYKNIGKENDTQYDIGMGIMSVADKLAAVFVSAFNSNKNKTTNTIDDIKITADKDNINEVVNEVRQLRLEAKSKNLPDIGFAYNYDINKIEKARDNILKDISNVVSSFSNLDVNTMDSTQRSRISKQYSINAMTPRGIFESKLRNTAEVRDIFNGKIYINPKDSNKGIRKEQLDAIEKVFSITNKLSPDDRIARIQKIQDKYNTLTPNEQHILSEKAIRDAQDKYSDFIANRESPSAMNTSHLEAAKNIFKQFNIDTTTLTGENIQDIYNNLSTQQQEYIKDLTFIEQKRNANGVFTESEANQLSMMFEKLAMIEEAYNKLLNIATPELAELDDELKGKFSLSELVFNNAQIGSPGAYESGYSIEDIVEEIISNDKNYSNKNKLKVRDIKNDLSKGYYGGKEFNNNQIDNIIRDATNRIENKQSTHQKSKLNICECFKNGIEKILQKMDSLVSVDAINIQTALLDRLKISLGNTKYYEELEKLKATNEQNIRATDAGQEKEILDEIKKTNEKIEEQNQKFDRMDENLQALEQNQELMTKGIISVAEQMMGNSSRFFIPSLESSQKEYVPTLLIEADTISNITVTDSDSFTNIDFSKFILPLERIMEIDGTLLADNVDKFFIDIINKEVISNLVQYMMADFEDAIIDGLLSTTIISDPGRLLSTQALTPTNKITSTPYPLSAVNPNILFLPSGIGQSFQQPFPNFISNDEIKGALIQLLDKKINTLVDISKQTKKHEADIKKELLNISKIITQRYNIQKHVGDTNRRIAGKKYRESIASNQYFEPIGPIEKEPTVYKRIALAQGGQIAYEKAYRNYAYRGVIGPQPAPGFILPQYQHPIGPSEDKSDLTKLRQLEIIKEEEKQKRLQKISQDAAKLRARTAIEDEERTIRYNEKMAQRKLANDKKAIEKAERLRERSRLNALLRDISNSTITHHHGVVQIRPPRSKNQSPVEEYKSFAPGLTQYYQYRSRQIRAINRQIQEREELIREQEQKQKEKAEKLLNEHNYIEAQRDINTKWNQTKRLRVFGGVIANKGAVQGPQPIEAIQGPKLPTQKDKVQLSLLKLKERKKIHDQEMQLYAQLYAQLYPNYNDLEKAIYNENKPQYNPQQATPFSYTQKTYTDANNMQMFGKIVHNLQNQKIIDFVDDNINQYNQKILDYSGAYQTSNLKTIYNGDLYIKNLKQATQALEMFNDSLNNFDNISQHIHTSKPNIYTLQYAQERFRQGTYTNQDLFTLGISTPSKIEEKRGQRKSQILEEEQQGVAKLYRQYNKQRQYIQEFNFVKDFFDNNNKIQQQYDMIKEFNQSQKDLLNISEQITEQENVISNFKRMNDNLDEINNNLEKEIQNQKESIEIAEQLGPGMLHTMRHQLNVDKYEEERKQQKLEEEAKRYRHIQGVLIGYGSDAEKEEVYAQYSHISGVNTNANYEGLSDIEKAKMKADHRYGKEYERETIIGEDGKPHLSDYKVKREQSWGERAERFGIKMAGVKEQFFDAASNVADRYPEEQAKQYLKTIGGTKDKAEGALEAMKGFNAGLERAAEVFPPFTIAVTAMDTAIQIGEGIVWALDIAQNILSATQSFGILQTLSLATAEQVEALEKGVATLATWGLTTAMAALEAVMLPLLIVVGAVIAAISLLKFWENKHAESLKKTQEALKEATAKNNTALSQYKDLKKARENETDAIKKQQAARKEAIALYELEAARVKQNKAIKEESKVRNDAVWGEYGMRADLQKAGLGIIAGGDFESQYEQYDGTTKNIRQIKESTVGDIFKPTGAKAQVANTYDDNHMFFAMVEAYQKPLTELYSKESKLIEQYGSLDDARASEEFYEAVQEFADATGLQGETAGKMLDWLETENKVNQATQAMQARVNMIVAKADANALAAEVEDTDFGAQNLQEAMIYAQAQDIYKEAYDYMWWESFKAELFGILWTIADTAMFWDLTDHATKYWKKSEAYQEGMKELSELGVQGVYEVGNNTAEHADRRDYGSSGGLYYDTPFGGAKESAALQYADQQQQKAFDQNHIVYSESEYQAIQENYLNYGPDADMQLHDMIKSEKEYTQKEAKDFQDSLNKDMTKTGQAGVEGFKKGLDQHSPGLISRSVQDEMIYSNNFIIEATPQLSESTHDLGSEMSDSHKDALAISDNTQQEMVNVNDTIKDSKDTINPTAYDAGYEAGQEYGKGFKEGLKDLFAQISSPEALEQTLEDRILVRQGYGTPKGADPNDPEVQKKQEERRIETESKLLARGFSLPSFSTFAKNEGKAAYRVAKGGGLRSWKDTSVIGRIANAAEIGLTEGSLSKGLKALFAPKYGEEFGVKGAKHAVNKLFGRETGEAVARAPTGKVVGAVDDTLGKAGAKGGKYVEKGLSKLGIEGGESLAEIGGKFVARHFGDDAAKLAVKGGSKLAKMGSKALPFVGTAITAATSIMEHNPFEKHYNEDGSEKRALQSTGEVAGEITGALASDVVGVIAGPVAGMAAGLILEPIGEAIGGTIGWMADEVVNTKFTDAWAGFNDALGGIPGQLVDFIDQSPIGQAGHWAFDQIDNLTGGWLGDTWEYVKNSSIAELTGLDQLGGALQGMGEWLFGSGEDQQEQLPAPDQITDEQIAELENAGMLDEYLASYGLDKEQKNILNKDKTQKIQPMGNGSTVIIKNININTEDDPEKIKSALMNLIIEMQEQVNPRQVSRTVGEPPATQSTSTDQNQNNTAQAQGTDPQSGTNNNTNPNMSPNTNT